MSSMVINQTQVGCFVANTVLGKSGKQFQHEVERFLSQNGPEWTVSRLKVIWNAANHLRNGDKLSAIQLYQENSISYHRVDGTPKGPFRPAVVGYSHAQRPSKVKAFAAVMRVYTSFKVSDLTEKQSRKAYNAITSPSESRMQIERFASSTVATGPKVIRDLMVGVGTGRISKDYIPPISSRYANSLRSTSRYYSRTGLPSGWSPRTNPYSSMVLSFMTEPWIPKSLDELTPTFEMREIIRSQGSFGTQEFAGKIAALQEQGVKARVVAMPSAYIQLAFSPLHKRLNDIIRHSFPRESCMDDQKKGINGVIRSLQSGNNVYSVDLSSATDRFPRDFSIQILRDLGMGNYADALREVSESKWDSPWGPVTYGAGQPMGLYGSFPLFHLSNALVAHKSEMEVRSTIKKNPSEPSLVSFHEGNTFYVLGDDIVFSDPRVSSEYRKSIGLLGVQISEHKSFSGKVAEFAGFMAVPTSHGVIGFRPYKVPVGNWVQNPVDLLAAIGPSLSKVSPVWKARFADYQATAVMRSIDLSPIFSEDDGVGNNPFRGDASTFVNLANVIAMQLPVDSLPDLSGSTKVNSIPMFNERGFGDYYGFSPKELSSNDLPVRGGHKETSKRLYDDPLMKEARTNRPEKPTAVPGAQSFSSLNKELNDKHTPIDGKPLKERFPELFQSEDLPVDTASRQEFE